MRYAWTEELIRSELLMSIKALAINRMPTAAELKSIGRNDLHIKISRTKKYTGWAEELGLALKSCDTRTGQQYEKVILEYLEGQGFQVDRMTLKHPFDLLVNETVKVDVKVGRAYLIRGSRCHTFALAKRYASCDIYICVALDEADNIERIFVIPAHEARNVTISVGRHSRYNKYLDRFDYISMFDRFMRSVSENETFRGGREDVRSMHHSTA